MRVGVIFVNEDAVGRVAAGASVLQLVTKKALNRTCSTRSRRERRRRWTAGMFTLGSLGRIEFGSVYDTRGPVLRSCARIPIIAMLGYNYLPKR